MSLLFPEFPFPDPYWPRRLPNGRLVSQPSVTQPEIKTCKDMGDHFVAKLELPGIVPQDVSVEATKSNVKVAYPNNSISIAAKNIDPDKVTATLKYGILTVTMPKAVYGDGVKVAVTED